ncbi:hypothetical protein GHT07_11475 [Caenimonas koreensis DSM 17982]|uniref:Uncharacterized protein n=1 Tax=Caenimonas koreensis DSM 17982 TaxID=1121255 RepID=A0A844BBL6_9BURK|nr:hypothetical protein [Caenimonas koreensis]MRD47901.1 hypothetical protein [Caenimonas koreensis DSM 17982]
MGRQQLLWAAWPAFLAACALELLVFAFVDPTDMQLGGQPLTLSRQGVYSIAFFLFWGISFAAGVLASALRLPADDVDRCPFKPGDRPDDCLRH